MAYAQTRNFKDGAVTYLSPYISRGVLSTRQIFDHTQSLELPLQQTEKLIQELAWRDYWQQIWLAKKDLIETDLKHPQNPVYHYKIPKSVVEAQTGIQAVDLAIKDLYETGYMHNHMRMYVASICCNIAKSHWLEPARWLYAHLLDGDLASNHLSWQWVAGTNSNKKYIANQQNINKYFQSDQKNTFLDVDYEELLSMQVPESLQETVPFRMVDQLPITEAPTIEAEETSLIYNIYNLDPGWHTEEDVQRILLLEPSFFKKYPVSNKVLDFVFGLSRNIPNIKYFVGEFTELSSLLNKEKIIFKEHPTNAHYQGIQEERDWLSSVEGYYPSFFAFWKKCSKEIKP